MKIDYDLLREQHDFLLGYAWREDWIPEEVEGVLKVISYLIDEEEKRNA